MVEVIYADHAATSPVREEVLQEMLPYLQQAYGNASSIHQFGRQAKQALEDARTSIAESFAVNEKTLTFTSGGTEAANMAILGYAFANKEKGNHIITTEVEHLAVLNACRELERHGFEVTYIPVDENGLVSVANIRAALRAETILVSCMFVNNEVGTIQPIEEIGQLLEDHQAVLHTDAVQACGAIQVNLAHLSVHLFSVSAHKINGPKGVGLLYVKDGIKLHPLFFGGEQERKRRAGTENIAGIVGFAKALQLSNETIDKRTQVYEQYKEILRDRWLAAGVKFIVNADKTATAPHIFNVSYPDVQLESLLTSFDLAKIAVSSGSACTAGTTRPSHVLIAMYGEEDERVASSVRFSFGITHSTEQVEELANRSAAILTRLQAGHEFIK